MEKILKAGILRETKDPPDRRVPLIPSQVAGLQELFPHIKFFVQPSELRAYTDEEYESLSIAVKEDLSECDILMGVKEVDEDTLIAGKTYLFFPHVTKQQSYNRELFRKMAEKKITLIDYECLATETGQRVVAFGRWAGIVGAYNGLMARGIITGKFNLKPAWQCRDLNEMWKGLRQVTLIPGLKILVTGKGRVANGAKETLETAGVRQVSPDEFLTGESELPQFCLLGPEQYVRHKNGEEFRFSHFFEYPMEYESSFAPYTKVTDILITGHYWDTRSPLFITNVDMNKPGFRISVIADISCDINGPIASTTRATTIEDPFYDYNPGSGSEEAAFSSPSNITVMAVDNLPCELPRDSSADFGRQLMVSALPDLLAGAESPMIERATILKKGRLMEEYEYLNEYLYG